MTHDYEALDGIKAWGIIDRGGAILGTSRLSRFYVEKGTEHVFAAFERLGLEGLIVLGGEGTLSAACRMFEMGLPVIGIPQDLRCEGDGLRDSIPDRGADRHWRARHASLGC